MRRLCLTVACAALLGGAGLQAADAASGPALAPTVATATANVVPAYWVWHHGRRYWRGPPPHRYWRHGRWYYR